MDLRPAFLFERAGVRGQVYIDRTGRLPLIYGCQSDTSSLCLVLQPHPVYGKLRMPALGKIAVIERLRVRLFHIANDKIIILIVNH